MLLLWKSLYAHMLIITIIMFDALYFCTVMSLLSTQVCTWNQSLIYTIESDLISCPQKAHIQCCCLRHCIPCFYHWLNLLLIWYLYVGKDGNDVAELVIQYLYLFSALIWEFLQCVSLCWTFGASDRLVPPLGVPLLLWDANSKILWVLITCAFMSDC